LLGLDKEQLKEDLYAWPDRGRAVEMPPKDPLIYRLYEIIQVCVVAEGNRRGRFAFADLWLS